MVNAESDGSTSVVSLIELLQGARSPAQLKTARDFEYKLEIRVLPATENIGSRALALIESYAPGDGLIAATALEHDDTLFTGNVPHFRAIRGLKIKPLRHSGVH